METVLSLSEVEGLDFRTVLGRVYRHPESNLIVHFYGPHTTWVVTPPR